MTKRCAFLSMDNPDSFTIDDELAYAPLRSLGWQVETVSWRRSDAVWDDFDLVIIRSPWDYQNAPQDFMRVLEQIDASKAHLQNSLELVRWNLDKRYLRELGERGIPIVPTLWGDTAGELANMDSWFAKLSLYNHSTELASELIIKPVVSANADHTYRLPYLTRKMLEPSLRSVFSDRAFMVQPFVPSVIDEGEFSLFYFAGAYSHTILKTPKAEDFRVQEEHGGIIRGIEPSAALRVQADAAMAVLTAVPLYARLDFVRLPSDNNRERFVVMEFELIEPALYLRMDAGAPERFANAVNAWMMR
jgi:hypothetical protein